MAPGSVKLLGNWASSYTHRVQVALKLKGVDFEYVEEDLSSKSARLLHHNPVHKMVPVLLHGQDAIAESVVILEYIEETWGENPIMPAEPLERARVRFWARFVDEKLGPAVSEVFRMRGEEQTAAVASVHHYLNMLEGELRHGAFSGRRFFGGDGIGLLDIVIGCGSYWLWAFEEVAGVSLVSPDLCPRLSSWLRDFEAQEEVREIIPAADKLLEYAQHVRQSVRHSKDDRNSDQPC